MKKILLSLAALFCVALLYAQNNEAPSLANEEYFKQSDLVFEGNFMRVVATYDTKGNGNYDDIYSISEYRVQTVYKGGEVTSSGNTVLIVSKGGRLGEENIDWGNVEYGNILPTHFKERGIPGVNATSPSIFFLIKSDFPDDENSIYFMEKKYKLIDPLGRIYVWGNFIGGLGTFDFQNREELHNYMRHFEGYTLPDWKPGLNWVNGNEQEASIFDTKYYENQKNIIDSINNETIIEIEKDIKEKRTRKCGQKSGK